MSLRDEAFEAFEEAGPDAHSAAEWADKLGTSKDYVYQLRGDYKSEHAASDEEDTEGNSEPSDSTGEGSAETIGEQDDSERSQNSPDRDDPEGLESEETSENSLTLDPESESTEPVEEAAATETVTDGGPESIEVGTEGKEKLSPDGFEDKTVASIDAPDGVELPEGTTPDDLEAEQAEASAESTRTETDDLPTTAEQESESAPTEAESGGGLLDMIRGDEEPEPESAEAVVEEAPTEAERDRRGEVLGALEQATEPDTAEVADAETENDGDGPNPTTMSNGLTVDQDLVETLFGMPFSQLSSATGWDGWELTEQEKAANAELLVAYCDEQDIDLSTGGMLAMSLLSTVGGRAVGYQKYRKSEQSDEPEPVEQRPDRDDAPDESTEPDEQQSPRSAATTPAETGGDRAAATDGGNSTEETSFDPNDPSTWE